MVNYTCERCQKQFNRKSNYDYHINNKKNQCKLNIHDESTMNPTESNLNPNESNSSSKNNVKVYECKYCQNIFSTSSNLSKHIKKSCKDKKNLDEQEKIIEENKLLKNQLVQQSKDMAEQTKQIEELKRMFYEFSKKDNKRTNKNITNTSTNSNNTTNIQTQNNTNNTQNNINIILPHGKELEKIELGEVLDHMLTYDFDNMVQKLVKHIYLNDNKPQNKNFVVNDMSRNKCQFYDGEKWITGLASDLILKLFENTNSLFIDPFDKPEIEKTIEFIRKNKKYSEKYGTILKCKTYAKSLFDETEKENIDKREQLLKELKLIFYSHKDEILKISL